MTLGLHHADDSCQVNQTVGSASLPVSSARIENEKQDPLSTGEGSSTLPDVTSADDDSGVELTYPEGGLEAWLVVVGSFCAQLSIYGVINSSAVYESYFSTHQLAEYSPSSIGWIFSLYLFIVFFGGLQVGPVFDRRGARLLLIVGSILTVASQLLLGLCERK
jgi:hypothetical protein